MNYTRAWITAFRNYAERNNGQFPISFDQAMPFWPADGNTDTNLTPDQFEILYRGSGASLTYPPRVMVLREKHAWSDSSGTSWSRTYGFADGHSEIHKIPNVTNSAEASEADRNLNAWEKQRIIPPPTGQ
jgi:hypothetical protein